LEAIACSGRKMNNELKKDMRGAESTKKDGRKDKEEG
jgi:hypothetical protein